MNLGGNNSSSALANFGVYMQTPVGLSELSIRTLVSGPISAEPYRKALIVKLFFHQILSLTDSPSVFVNDLMAIVAVYLDINTGSAEREAEAATNSISRSFSMCQTWSALPFLTLPNSLFFFKVTDFDNRQADITYFTFRFNVSANIVDCRAPNKYLALEFLLRFSNA